MKPRSQAPAVDSKNRARTHNVHKQKELQPANVKPCQEGCIWNSSSSGRSTSPGNMHTEAKIPSCVQECMCTSTVIWGTDTGHPSFKTESGCLHCLQTRLAVRECGFEYWPFFILTAAKQNTVFIYVTWVGGAYCFKWDDIAYKHIFCSDEFVVLVDHTSDKALGFDDRTVPSASICWPPSQAQPCCVAEKHAYHPCRHTSTDSPEANYGCRWEEIWKTAEWLHNAFLVLEVRIVLVTTSDG